MSFRLFNFTFFLIIALISGISFISAEISDFLYESDEKTFTLDGISYTVRADFVGSASAKLTHNDEITTTLHQGETHVFSDGLSLTFDSISHYELPGGIRRIEFTLNKISICGDSVCSAAETCISDKCCNGLVKDFGADINHCGSCNNVCSSNNACVAGTCSDIPVPPGSSCGNGICDASETCGSCYKDCGCDSSKKCENGLCITFCGNGICDADEDYQSCISDCKNPVCGDNVCEAGKEDNCCVDCGCERGYTCSNNKCVQKDECIYNSDCDDLNICTVDLCSGTPKKCTIIANESCKKIPDHNYSKRVSDNETKTTADNSSDLKEGTIPRLQEVPKEKKSFISKIFNFFKSLFGK